MACSERQASITFSRQASPPFAIERRSASDSISMRVWVRSIRSGMESGLARKPRWSSATTRPAAIRRESASRTAARLTPKRLLMIEMLSFSPGRIRQLTTSARNCM
jgi:hypothetical protein